MAGGEPFHDYKAGSRLSQLWRRLTEPSPSVRGLEDRWRARFLAAHVLLLFPFSLLVAALVWSWAENRFFEAAGAALVVAIAMALGAGIYALARAGRLKPASNLLVALAAGAALLAALINRSPAESRALYVLALPLVIGSFLLPLRALVALALALLAGLVCLPLVRTDMPWPALADPLGVYLIMAAHILSIAHFRNGLDAERRAELERRVAERTAELTAANDRLSREFASRQQIEQALVQERNLLRALIDAMPDAVFVLDRNLRYLLDNPAHRAHVRERATDEIVGRDAYDYFPPETAARFQEEERAVFATGQPMLNLETLETEADGSVSWWLTSKVPFRDADGQIVGLVGIARDITQRKLAELELAEERNRLRTLIDHLPDHVYVKDTQGRFVIVNPAAARYLGISTPQDAVGKTDADFFPPDQAAQFMADEQAIFQTGQPIINTEYHMVGSDGVERFLLGMKIPLRDAAGHIIGLVGVDRDITELKRAQQALEQVNALLEQRIAERTAALAEANLRLTEEICERIQAESQLRYQANLLENVSDAIISFDTNFIVRTWNHGAETIYGWTAQEAVGRSLLELLGTNLSAETIQASVTELISLGAWRGEVAHSRRDGTVITVQSSASAIRDSSGTIIGFVSVNRDITLQTQAEAAERERRLLTEAIQDTAAAISQSLELDVVLDRILLHLAQLVPCDLANIAFIEMGIARVVRRWSAERANGFEPFVPDLPVDTTATLRTMLETRRPLLVADVRQYPAWVSIDAARDTVRSYLGAPIQVDGQVIGFLNANHSRPNVFNAAHVERIQLFADQVSVAVRNARLYEMARLHAAELETRVAARTAELENERAQLQAILDSMSEGVIGVMYTGADHDLRFVNQALTRMMGYNASNWDVDLLHTEDETAEARAQTQREFLKLIAEGGLWRAERRLRRRDGTTFEAELTSSGVQSADGTLIGIVTVIRDISQEKALEAQKARFVANASHELRTPITNLMTRLYLIRRQPDKLDEHLEVLDQIAGRMRRLVEDLLDLPRFEHGLIPLRLQRVDMGLLAAEVAQMQAPEAERKRISLVCDRPPEPVYVRADRERLNQVITNLVTNAINYTPPGGDVRLSVTVQPDFGLVTLQVADTGPGIAPEHLEHVFEPFYRVDERSKGSGLGLAIAREIIQQHGGEIWVESQVGFGSRFYVRLALASEDGTDES